MARQSITLASGGWTSRVANLRGWIIDASRTKIIDALDGGNDRWLIQVEANSFGRITVGFSNSSTTPWASDPSGHDLTTVFEQLGHVEITVGSTTWTFELAGADITEPYFWAPSNAATDGVAFFNAIATATAATLVIDDGAGVAPHFSDDTGDAITGLAGQAITPVTVPAAGGAPPNSQSIALPSSAWRQANPSIRQYLFSTGSRPQIDASLVPSGTERFLVAVNIRNDGQVAFILEESQTSSISGAEDLTTVFEQLGRVEVTVGATTWVFELAGADISEPYSWIPSNSSNAVAYYNAIASATAATFVIRDGDPNRAADPAPTYAVVGSLPAGLTVTPPTPGTDPVNSQSIALPSSRWVEAAGFHRSYLFPANNRVAIDAALVPDGQSAFMSVFRVSTTGEITLLLDAGQTGGVDQDLTDRFEQLGRVEVTVGTSTWTFELAGADTDEPYAWTPANAATDGVAFYNAIASAIDATLVIRDGDPAGVRQDGEITGTPTAAGSGTITIRATNVEGSDDWTVGYTFLEARLDASFVGGLTGNLAAGVTLGALPDLELDAAFTGDLDGTLAGTVALGQAPPLTIGATFQGNIDGTLAAGVALGIPPRLIARTTFDGNIDGTLFGAVRAGISLADFIAGNRFVDCAAAIRRTHATRLYSTGRWGGDNSPFQGDLNISSSDEPLDRIVWVNDRLVINDAGALDLGTYFGVGGDGADLNITVITLAGEATVAVADVRPNQSGNNFAQFGSDPALPIPQAMRDILNGINVGDAYVFALWRDQPSVSAGAAFTGDLDGTFAGQVALGQTPLVLAAAFDGELDGTLLPNAQLGTAPDVALSAAFAGNLDGTLAAEAWLFGGPGLPIGAAFTGDLDGTLAAALALGPPPGLQIAAAFAGNLFGTTVATFDVRDLIVPWPAALPQDFLRDGFTAQPRPNTLRFRVDEGTPLRRPLFADSVTRYRGVMRLTRAEWAMLNEFYEDTLFQGSRAFEFPRPLAAGNVVVKFARRPARRPRGVDWGVSIVLDTVP